MRSEAKSTVSRNLSCRTFSGRLLTSRERARCSDIHVAPSSDADGAREHGSEAHTLFSAGGDHVLLVQYQASLAPLRV
eukprot:6205350-Pleurochrysis_carterae.AAC.4